MYWLLGAIGLGVAVAPFLFRFSHNPLAAGIVLVLGGIVVVISGVKATFRQAAWWEYAVAGLMGLAIVAAPFLLGLSLQHKALAISIALGILVILLAGYQGFFSRPQAK